VPRGTFPPVEPCVRLFTAHGSDSPCLFAGSSRWPCDPTWLRLAAHGCHLPFPIRFTSFPVTLPAATRLTSAAFRRGYVQCWPYLPGYVFPLPFGWQLSLLEASCAHWGLGPSLRLAYSGSPETPLGLPRSTRVRCHRGGCLLYRGEGVSTKSAREPDSPCSQHHRYSRLR
jgi:hypothetical protein